jgi:hypothetical protein
MSDGQGFFGYGYFVEDSEMDAPNYLKTAERKKVLSNIESLGLLSAAEKAGLSLSKARAHSTCQGSLLHRNVKALARRVDMVLSVSLPIKHSFRLCPATETTCPRELCQTLSQMALWGSKGVTSV